MHILEKKNRNIKFDYTELWKLTKVNKKLKKGKELKVLFMF